MSSTIFSRWCVCVCLRLMHINSMYSRFFTPSRHNHYGYGIYCSSYPFGLMHEHAHHFGTLSLSSFSLPCVRWLHSIAFESYFIGEKSSNSRLRWTHDERKRIRANGMHENSRKRATFCLYKIDESAITRLSHTSSSYCQLLPFSCRFCCCFVLRFFMRYIRLFKVGLRFRMQFSHMCEW